MNPVDTDIVGTYTVTYNVADANSNNGLEVTRTVNVESSLSVKDNPNNILKIYPNPTSDIVYIDGNYSQLKVVVYDILGKQVMNKSITKSIDISQLKKGVYILQLFDGAKLTTQRIIKN